MTAFRCCIPLTAGPKTELHSEKEKCYRSIQVSLSPRPPQAHSRILQVDLVRCSHVGAAFSAFFAPSRHSRMSRIDVRLLHEYLLSGRLIVQHACRHRHPKSTRSPQQYHMIVHLHPDTSSPLFRVREEVGRRPAFFGSSSARIENERTERCTTVGTIGVREEGMLFEAKVDSSARMRPP